MKENLPINHIGYPVYMETEPIGFFLLHRACHFANPLFVTWQMLYANTWIWKGSLYHILLLQMKNNLLLILQK